MRTPVKSKRKRRNGGSGTGRIRPHRSEASPHPAAASSTVPEAESTAGGNKGLKIMFAGGAIRVRISPVAVSAKTHSHTPQTRAVPESSSTARKKSAGSRGSTHSIPGFPGMHGCSGAYVCAELISCENPAPAEDESTVQRAFPSASHCPAASRMSGSPHSSAY